MKRWFVGILLVLLTAGWCQAFSPPEPGKSAPDFTATTLDGQRYSLDDDLKGKKPVLLVFWATWCEVCKEKWPEIEDLYKTYGDRMQFLAINVGVNDNLDSVKAYVEQRDLKLPVVFDEDSEISVSFWVNMTPLDILVDKNGTIVYKDVKLPTRMELERVLAK